MTETAHLGVLGSRERKKERWLGGRAGSSQGQDMFFHSILAMTHFPN